jgi:hypothetical protein
MEIVKVMSYLIIGLFNLIVLAMFVVVPVIAFTGLHVSTGSGEHTGYITAVEKRGIVWKTWRAYVKTDTASSQEDRYCVIDEDVVAAIKKASEEKQKVTLKYHSFISAGLTNCDAEGDIIGGIK